MAAVESPGSGDAGASQVSGRGQWWKYLVRAPVLASMTGCLFVLSAPPIDLWPLGLVALVPLHVAIRQCSVLKAALLGWLAGFVAHLGTQLWWVEFLGRFTVLSLPPRVLGAGAVFVFEAAVFALWTGVARLVVGRYGVSWLVASPLALVLAEWTLPSLFPWHVGIDLWKAWSLTQVAELGGVWAVSALVVATNALLAEVGVALSRGARLPRGAFIAAGILTSAVVLGLARAYQVGAAEDAAPKLRAGIVQPNFGALPSGERVRHGRRLLRKLGRANRRLTDQGAQLIVWSEAVWPYLFDRSLTREFQANHPWSLGERGPSSLVMGAATHAFGTELVYNSALLFLASGELAGRYDKQLPVPFGEYVPFGERYPRFQTAARRVIPARLTITPGADTVLLVDGEACLGVLICNEELEPDLAARAARRGVNLLVGMGNDAWFGASPAPRQHFALAVFRAVETRRQLLRATSTGVSGHVDALGRVRVTGPLYEAPKGPDLEPTLLSAEVSLLEVPTPGPLLVPHFPKACAFALGAAILIARVTRRGPTRRRRRRRATR